MNANATPIGTIVTRRDYPGAVTTICRQCGQSTNVDFGTITRSCPHIAVRFCDDGTDA